MKETDRQTDKATKIKQSKLNRNLERKKKNKENEWKKKVINQKIEI